MKIISSTLALLATSIACIVAVVVNAEKDTEYYRPGVSNPNVKYDMYWKEAKNVIQDLSKFSKLYIKFHNCAWTKYALPYGNYGNNNEIGYGGDNDSGGMCPSDYGGYAFWYMGNSLCFRANAAYSLYGVLADDESNKKKKKTGCQESTYINSFFTLTGVSTFMEAIEDAGYYQFCEAYDGGMYENNNNRNLEDSCGWIDSSSQQGRRRDLVGDRQQSQEQQQQQQQQRRKLDQENAHGSYAGVSATCYSDYVQGDDDFWQQEYTDDQISVAENGIRSFPDATSYTVGCDASNGAFVFSQFNGAYCSGNFFEDVVDELQNFNDEMNNLGCYPIYDSSLNLDVATGLLRKSVACSLREYPNRCPDPYGKLKKYTKKLERATRAVSSSPTGASFWSHLVMALGCLLIVMTLFTTGRAIRQVGGAKKAYAALKGTSS